MLRRLKIKLAIMSLKKGSGPRSSNKESIFTAQEPCLLTGKLTGSLEGENEETSVIPCLVVKAH